MSQLVQLLLFAPNDCELSDSGRIIAFYSGVKRRKVVLVAEDDVIVRNLINIVLVRADYSVLLGCDGQEALEISRAYDGAIDLLLTDVKMPRLDGRSLADLIRRERPETKTLVISGRMSSEVRTATVDFSFLRKPFLPSELIESIDSIFQA